MARMTETIWVTAEEAAQRLGCSVRTVWRIAARGEMPAMAEKGSRRTLFAVDAVEPCERCGCLCSGRMTPRRAASIDSRVS